MTDEQVIEVLAKRMGWTGLTMLTRYDESEAWGYPAENPPPYRLGAMRKVPFLTSRDALAPVLAGLSPDEKKKLHWSIAEKANAKSKEDCALIHEWQWLWWTIHILTLPPHDLAHAIAEASEPSPNKTLDTPNPVS